ncbi:eukaryotic translation initiation factor 4 gamma 1 isoform X2 [Microcaecilia unicolor]|uniref:Eukaryotic translation initiation factor 4 gamma 1 isoform X2 n=1 Tax=Microcaecilia unicolor TaxID=1415580 RepID=A0A6P7Z8S9_9AMPH|nr:eukaryotic translation initiation factor 4 gamma 1 isoform X2 [Microcaecilia unicolor]
MNKAAQPIGGPPAAPHPAPSPGLSQSSYPPAQTVPVVFGPPQSSQMNTPSQPRQHFYQNRPQPPTSASRLPSTTTARAVPPAHVYPTSSQVMMIPSQLSYPTSQGYYIQGQGRSYVVPTQQYPVQPGAPSFFPGASPTDYSTYAPAGAYYPAQGVQQFPPGVPAPPVMMNQPQQIPAKRERKTIRIRDPNQGGKDITEEIMSGARSSSTPPQVGGLEVQANGETSHVTVVIRADDRQTLTAAVNKVELDLSSESPSPPLLPPAMEAEPEMMLVATEESLQQKDTKAEMTELPPDQHLVNAPALSNTSISDSEPSVKCPAPPSLRATENLVLEPTTAFPVLKTLMLDTLELEKPQQPDIADEPILHLSQEEVTAELVGESNGVSGEVAGSECQPVSTCQMESIVDSPIAQPEELTVSSGLRGPEKIVVEVREEQPESDVSPIAEPEEVMVEEPLEKTIPPPEEDEMEAEKEELVEGEEQTKSVAAHSQGSDPAVQVAISVPKKKRKMRELNKKDAVGDLLDAFKESQAGDGASQTDSQTCAAVSGTEQEETVAAPQEDLEETWEEKEDKLDAENIQPGEQKYQYKEEQWKPLNPEEKKQYDREFLLGFQFILASMQKPEGLPQITDVVLDKANKAPLRPLDPTRLTNMNCGPDFTPSFANLGRQPVGNRGPPPGMGARRSQQGQRKETRKIIATVSLSEDVRLNKAEKAWKPTQKRNDQDLDPDSTKTQELFRRVRSILNKLTPQMFQQLMKQVTDLAIDTEERLKGVIDLIFEKAISEPNFSVAYANMCRCLMGLKVPTTDKPGVTVNFRKLLLNRCQKEFEKDQDDDEEFEKKQKELEAAATPEEKTRLREELEDARDKARRRSLGNIKFIGELFKLKMLTEAIMHDCVVKLLKNHDEESLECLCRLLSTIGKDLDFEKAKPRMAQYFHQMEKIIKERKTSSRIRFMLQDVIDLRLTNWVPRRGDQGPKTIDQIHKEAELEQHREQIKVQQLMSNKDKRRELPVRQTSGGRGGQVGDDGWNTVPISKGSRPIDTSRITKITKPASIDYNNQLLAPGGRLSWGKGSSGGTGAKPAESAPEPGRPAASTLNRFSALQQTSAAESPDSRRAVQRSSSSRDRSEKDRDRGDRFERFEKGSERSERLDRSEKGDRLEKNERDRNSRPPITKRSFSKETEDRSREREKRLPQESVRKVASMTEERDRSREAVKQEPTSAPAATTATVAALPKPSLTEDELEKKAKSITEEYLHINDIKEALQCVQELSSPSLLFIFVRNGIESTLERSTIAREHMGLLFYHLLKASVLPKDQYYKGLQEILEIAEDMEIDIPHIWLYLAEIITPVLLEGGIAMGELFRELSKPLIPLGKASFLLLEILGLLCKGMSHKKAGSLWKEAGLSWKEFLPEDQDVNKFITEKKLEYTLGEDSESPGRKELSSEDLYKQMEKLVKENPDNRRIFDWIEANLSEQQILSFAFTRALMTSVCQSAIIFENPYRVDIAVIRNRAKLLQKYINDEQRELQALYALQALVVKLEQPANLLRMFFDSLYDEDVIKEEAFYKWESSKDPAEQQGKGVALKSVTAFFTWLREAEDESDNNN